MASVLFSGTSLAWMGRVSPTLFRVEVGLTRMLVATGETVTSQVALYAPALAVMVALPAARPMTLPLSSTAATALPSLFTPVHVHVTVLSVAL